MQTTALLPSSFLLLKIQLTAVQRGTSFLYEALLLSEPVTSRAVAVTSSAFLEIWLFSQVPYFSVLEKASCSKRQCLLWGHLCRSRALTLTLTQSGSTNQHGASLDKPQFLSLFLFSVHFAHWWGARQDNKIYQSLMKITFGRLGKNRLLWE